jgi:hypothetical protein
MPSSFEFIASAIATAGSQSSLSFTSIPSTYEHLYVVFNCRSTRSSGGTDSLNIKFNNSSTSDYYTKRTASGLTPGIDVSAGGSSGYLSYCPQETSSDNWEANTWVNGTIIIPMYKYTQPKSYYCTWNVDNNTNYSAQGYAGGVFTPTGAINRIDIISASGNNISQYSSAYLYGIKI